MTNDEIAKYARECATMFCWEYKIDEQDREDFVQEGVLAALAAAQGKEVMNKSYISTRVRGELMDYRRTQRNGGIGGPDVMGYDYVSLAEAVVGATDDDGEPLTHGDLLVYPDPPEGFDDPINETARGEDELRLARALKTLTPEEQAFMQVAALSELTQEEAAAKLRISQPAVQRRLERLVRKLQSIML